MNLAPPVGAVDLVPPDGVEDLVPPVCMEDRLQTKLGFAVTWCVVALRSGAPTYESTFARNWENPPRTCQGLSGSPDAAVIECLRYLCP